MVPLQLSFRNSAETRRHSLLHARGAVGRGRQSRPRRDTALIWPWQERGTTQVLCMKGRQFALHVGAGDLARRFRCRRGVRAGSASRGMTYGQDSGQPRSCSRRWRLRLPRPYSAGAGSSRGRMIGVTGARLCDEQYIIYFAPAVLELCVPRPRSRDEDSPDRGERLDPSAVRVGGDLRRCLVPADGSQRMAAAARARSTATPALAIFIPSCRRTISGHSSC